MSPPISDRDIEMEDESLDERVRRLSTQHPEGGASTGEPALLPEFLEFADKANASKFGSKEQKQELLQVECDQTDAKITDRLKSVVRPGNFCKEFEKLSFVKKAVNDPDCRPFIEGIRDWMSKMAETCKRINALPENVRPHRKITLTF